MCFNPRDSSVSEGTSYSHIGARSVYKTSCLSSKIDTEISHVFLAVVVGFGMLSLFLSLFGCRPADCLAVNCV